MQGPLEGPLNWRTSLFLAVGVVVTVFMALLLSLADGLQVRLSLPPEPTEAVIAAVATTATPPTVSLPTATPTSPPPTATATASESDGKKATASPTPVTPVPVVPTCGVVPDDWVAYSVRRGDTLFRLAVNSGATVSAV